VQSVESTRVSHHRSTGITRPSLRNGFNGFLRALPGDRALLPPSLTRITPRNLTPASGRQDHTTSPSARNVIRLLTCRVHRIPHPTSVTIAIRPSFGTGWRGCRFDLGQAKTRIFLQEGLDSQISDLPVGQITLSFMVLQGARTHQFSPGAKSVMRRISDSTRT
jgi:hypothetical protein